MFITFEGIDGAGKSSHIEPCAELIRARGLPVVVTREPGGTPLAEEIRGLILSKDMDPVTETLLAFAARRDHVLNVIGPALARGAVVICDRFVDSTYAYQGAGRGIPGRQIDQLVNLTCFAEEPDLTLWFDLPAEIAASRVARNRRPDRFEGETKHFFERVRVGYENRAKNHPRFARIDASAAQEVVWHHVKNTISSRLDAWCESAESVNAWRGEAFASPRA